MYKVGPDHADVDTGHELGAKGTSAAFDPTSKVHKRWHLASKCLSLGVHAPGFFQQPRRVDCPSSFWLHLSTHMQCPLIVCMPACGLTGATVYTDVDAKSAFCHVWHVLLPGLQGPQVVPQPPAAAAAAAVPSRATAMQARGGVCAGSSSSRASHATTVQTRWTGPTWAASLAPCRWVKLGLGYLAAMLP
jgi:hypothetical protein